MLPCDHILQPGCDAKADLMRHGRQQIDTLIPVLSRKHSWTLGEGFFARCMRHFRKLSERLSILLNASAGYLTAHYIELRGQTLVYALPKLKKTARSTPTWAVATLPARSQMNRLTTLLDIRKRTADYAIFDCCALRSNATLSHAHPAPT